MAATPWAELIAAQDYSILAPRRIVSPLSSLPDGGGASGGRALAQRWRRARILASARHLIAERGCDGLAVRQLAEHSGVTPPTIYNLVGEREEVLYRAIYEALAVKISFVESCAAREDLNRVLLLADAFWASLAQDPAYSKAVVSAVADRRADRRAFSARIMAETGAAVNRWLRMLEKQGKLRPGRAAMNDSAIRMICHFMNDSVLDWCQSGQDLLALRLDLAKGVSLPLLAIVEEGEAERIESWLDRLEMARAQAKDKIWRLSARAPTGAIELPTAIWCQKARYSEAPATGSPAHGLRQQQEIEAFIIGGTR